jgi:hypothetical protein
MFFHRNQSAEGEASLQQRAVNWPHCGALETLTPECLRQISKEEGIDFATALLFDRFHKSPRHAEFIHRMDCLRQSFRPPADPLHASVVIVPGALYRERPEMGGDGQLVREVARTFGCPTEVIPVGSFGAVTDNARLVQDWFRRKRSERVIVVSLSKGGLDFKRALAAPDAFALFQNVVAWVNVCGPLDGTAMADWVLASRWRTWLLRWKCQWQKRDFRLITDLRHETPRDFSLPQGMKLLNLYGFPLRRHMTTAFSGFCHRTLSNQGPNDGTTALSDLLFWPGDVYPAWGMDHYFRPAGQARELITAVFQHLAQVTRLINTRA